MSQLLKEYKANWYKKNRVAIIQRQKKYYQEHKDTTRFAYIIKKRYGITVDAYLAFLSKQNGACAICKSRPSYRLVIDHDHKTGNVRGLLCTVCNLGLGHFDKGNLLQAVVQYLGGTN